MAKSNETIIDLVVNLQAKHSGVPELSGALTQLATRLKSGYEETGVAVARALNKIATANDETRNKLAGSKDVAALTAYNERLKDIVSTSKAIKEATNNLSFGQLFESAQKGVAALAYHFTSLDKSGQKTFTNLAEALNKIATPPKNAGEFESWLKTFNSTIRQLETQFIKTSVVGLHFGQSFIDGLRKTIGSDQIRGIFKQVFEGNTKLLQPLQQALGSDKFLIEFAKYVEKNFKEAFTAVQKGASDARDSLDTLGQKVRATDSEASNLKAGFVNVTNAVRDSIEQFQHFSTIHSVLNNQLKITDAELAKQQTNFVRYGEVTGQVATSLQAVGTAVNSFTAASTNIQSQIAAFEEYNTLVKKATEAVSQLKTEEKIASSLTNPENQAKQEAVINQLIIKLAQYQKELAAIDSIKIQGATTSFDAQKNAITALITELTKVKQSAPTEVQTAIDGLIAGLHTAILTTNNLTNDFGTFSNRSAEAVTKVDEAILKTAGNIGEALERRIKQLADYANVNLKTISIPPLELKTIGMGGVDDVRKMFDQINGMVNGMKDKWTAFASYLEQKGVKQNIISSLRTDVEILSPVLKDVQQNTQNFGAAFNSNSSEARTNLIALDSLLRIVSEDILGSASAFEGSRTAIKKLREDLDLIGGAEDNVKRIVDGVRRLTSGVASSAVEVRKLGDNLKNATNQGKNKVGPDDKDFADTKKSVDAIEKSLGGLTRTLESLQNAGAGVFTGTLKQELDSLHSTVLDLAVKLANTVKVPLADIKTSYIDDSLDKTSKEFINFQSAADKAMKGIAVSFLELEDKGKVFKSVEKSFLRMEQALSDPTKIETVLKRLTTVISNYQKGLSGNYNIIPSGKAKEATDELRGLITVLNEYITAQLTAVRLKLSEQMLLKPASRDTTLIADLKQQRQGYDALLHTLEGLSTGLEKSQKDFNDHKTVLELDRKATEDHINVINGLKSAYVAAKGATDQFNVANVLTAFDALSTGTIKSVSALDKIIQKLEEMKRVGYDIPQNALFKTDASGVQVAFKSIDEYIDHLKLLKKESTDFIETQSKVVEPLERVKKAFDDLQTAQGISAGTTIVGLSEATNLFSNSLVKAIDEFHKLTIGVQDFGSLQSAYTRHKENLAGLATSIDSVIVALKQMPVGSKVLFGGAEIGAEALANKLTLVGQTVAQQAAAISVALQAGGKSLNDFLLTGAQGSRYQLIEKQITDLSKNIAKAVKDIQDLGTAGKPIDLAEVERLKTLIADLVKERSAIMAEIKSGIERMQGGLASAQVNLPETSVAALNAEVAKAIGLFNTLTAIVEKATVSINEKTVSMGDISKMVTPVLQFNEAISNLDNQLTRSAQPTTTFDLAIQNMVATLKVVETQLGITTHAYDSFDKVQLKGMSGDLTIRLNELAKMYAEVTRSIVAMETATASNKGIGVSSTELDAAKAKAEALKKQMEELARAIGTMQRVIREKPEGTDILSTFGDSVASSVEKVKGAGALLSKFMSTVFESIIKNNSALHGMGVAEEEVVRRTRLTAAAIQEMETKLVTSLRSMDMMAMGLQMLGQAMVEPFKKALESFSKFSDTLAFIQGATNATSTQMEELSNAALIVGTTTRVSAQDAAEGLKQLALAGYDAEQSIAVLPTVVRLAQAAEMQLGATTEIVVNIMNSQRIGAEGIANAVDVLAVAANRSTATVTDMGTAFKYIGALAGTIGNEFTDTAGAVALLHNAGLRGSMAGTALRGTLQALLNPTKDEARVMGELSNRLGGVGLQIMDAQGKFVGFRKIIEQFEQAGMTTSEVLELFGQRAGPGMAALLQMGSKQLNTLVTDLENAEGATSQLSSNMEATFGGSVQKMKNSLEAFGEVIGHAIATPLSMLADAISVVAQRMVAFGNEFPAATAFLADLSGAVAVLFLAMGSLAMTWTMMIVPATQLFKFIGTITTVILGATAALNGLTAASAGQILMNKAFGASLLASTGAANKFMAALKILKIMIIGFGTALMNPLTPWGAAAWALVGIIGAVTYAFAFMKRDLGTVNAEFDKSREIIANNITTFRALRDQVITTANEVSNLRLTHPGISTEQFINLSAFQQQKEQFLTELDTLNTRLKESDLGKDVIRIERLDQVTGKLIGLTVIAKKTGDIFGQMDVSMLSTVGGTKALAQGITTLNDALNEVGKQKIKDSVIDQLAENFDRGEYQIKATLGKVGKDLEDSIKRQEETLLKMLAAKEILNSMDAQLNAAEVRGEKEKYAELSKARKEFLKQNISTAHGSPLIFDWNISKATKDLDEAKALYSKGRQLITNIVSLYEASNKGKKPTFEEFTSAIMKAAKKSGEFSEQEIVDLLPDMEKVWQEFQKRSESAASNVDFATSVEKIFRGLQRQTSAGAKQMDELIKVLTGRQEEIKKILDVYEKNSEAFAKVRDEFVAAGKAELELGIGDTERKLTTSLNQLVDQAYAGYGKIGSAAISWTNPATEAARTEAEKFRTIQDMKVAIASSSAGKMYNIFTTSLQKQIDDAERNTKVVENVFTIPLRLEAYDNGSVIKKFVAGGIKASRELFEFERTFDQTLFEKRVYQEEATLQNKSKVINKEMTQTQAFYDKVIPLYAEGTAKRIELEQEFATKQKELQQKGVDNSRTALNNLYNLHKQISDKIVTLKQNEAKLVERLDALRTKVNEAGLSEVQQRESQFAHISRLFQTARAAMQEGGYDKAIKAYEKITTLAENIQFDPVDERTKQRIKEVADAVEEGNHTATVANEQAAKRQLITIEEAGKAMQSSLTDFQTGVDEFAKQLDDLAKQMKDLKESFATEQHIQLDTSDATQKLVRLEERVLKLKRLLEAPASLVLTDTNFEELDKLGKELRNTTDLKQRAMLQKQILDNIQMQLDKTNNLAAVTRALNQATASYNKEPVVSGKAVVGMTVKDMDPNDVKGVNEALKEREAVLKNLGKAYESAGQAMDQATVDELANVSKASQAFNEGKDNTVVYTKEIADAIKQNGDEVERFNNLLILSSSRSTAAMVQDVNTIIPKMLELSKSMKDVAEDKNLDIQVRVAASTNLSQLYNEIGNLQTELTNLQTVDVVDALIAQMEGYRQAIRKTSDVNDATSKANLKNLDDDIDAMKRVRDATELTNQQKVKKAKEANDKMREIMSKEQPTQEIKVKASEATAKTAGVENAKVANEAAKAHPIMPPVVANKAQAEEAGTQIANQAQQKANEKPTMIGIAADPATVQKFKDEADRIKKEVEQGVGITWGAKLPPVMVKPQVDKSKLNQGLNEVVAVVDKTAAKLPIEADTQQLEVAAKDVETLKYKLTTLIQANAQFKFFQGNKTTQEIMDLIRSLDLLISKKDQAGNIQFAVTDTSISQATSKLHELHGAAIQVFGSLGNGSAAMSSYFEKAAWDLEKLRAVAKGDPTIANLGALQQAEDAFLKLRLAMELVKNTSESPISIVPIGAEQQLELVNTQLTQFKEKLSSLSTQELGFVGYENSLRGLQTELATFQQQVAQGVNLDPAKIDDFKQRFMELMSAAENKQIGIQFDPSGIENIKNILDGLSSALLNVPSLTVASDSSAVDTALQKVNQLLNLNGSTSTIDVIANIIRQESGGYQKGGLVNSISRFMAGGVAQVQHLATGGSLLFKRIINKVPGVGVGDKIPAMLEPGEYVIKRSIVNDLGIGFFNHLNSGLLQFKQLGGLMYNAPNILLKDLSPQLKASFGGFTTPALATQNSSVDINLSFGNKGFNIRKVPRESVGTLVEALRYLERGLK